VVVHPELHLELVELAEGLKGVLEFDEEVHQLIVVLLLGLHLFLSHVLGNSLLSQLPGLHLNDLGPLQSLPGLPVEFLQVVDALDENLLDEEWIFLDFQQHDEGQVVDFLDDGPLKVDFGDALEELLVDVVLLEEVDSRIGLHVEVGEEDDDWILLLLLRQLLCHLHQGLEVLLLEQNLAMVGQDLTHQEAVVSDDFQRFVGLLVDLESAFDFLPEGSEVAV
jgi:hypothetical protein